MASQSQTPWQAPFEAPVLSLEDIPEQLRALRRKGISPMLETVVEMLDELNRPDSHYPVIQIGGTNGKTSTSTWTAALLQASGLKTCLYTSPHLVSITERIRIDGVPVDDNVFCQAFSLAEEAGRRVNARRMAAGKEPRDITEFDVLTVACLVACAMESVDAAVLEVGMGGRWDATTATHPAVTAVTGIALDHMRILGDTEEQIASEKAAIIKPGQSVVLGPGTQRNPDVRAVFDERCAEAGVIPWIVTPVGEKPDPLQVGERVLLKPSERHGELELAIILPAGGLFRGTFHLPAYQAANAAVALAVFECFRSRFHTPALSEREFCRVIKETPVPGRFQFIDDGHTQLVDAAHNPEGIEAFLASYRAIAPDPQERPPLLCAMLSDRNISLMASMLAAEFPVILTTQTEEPRAVAAKELADAFRDAGVPYPVVYGSVAGALTAIGDGPFVAVGTISLIGEVLRYKVKHL